MGGGEKADVLEPEKCPLPRDVGPFFPLLTGGENIYKTNRAHITSESTDTADSKTHIYKNVTATSHEKLHSKTPGQHLAEKCCCQHVMLGNVLNVMVI